MQSTLMIFKLALLLMLTACSSVSLSTAQQTGGAASEFTPIVYSIEPSAECDQYNPLHDQELMKKLTETVTKLPRTCVSIHSGNPSAPSGYYNITTTNGSSVEVYCDMEGTNCGGEGGWTRVAYVNMTQPGATCPQGLERKSSTNYTLCGLNINHGCDSTMFSTPVEYSKVCGQVRGYQYSPPIAFYAYNINTSLTIDDVYVDGVSITYGNAPRKHIWTYAGGPYDTVTSTANCPCKHASTVITPPYVGTDYYCESGVNICCLWSAVAAADPLWDGQQCGGGEVPCCTQPNMPWFIKKLNETTTEDIELRLCKIGMYGSTITGDTPLDLIELLVQ